MWNGSSNDGEFWITGDAFTPSEATKYYDFGGQRIAMRKAGVVYYLHGDHLGSTSLTTNASGGAVARQLYYPYGEVRWSSGTLPTDYTFTGQRNESSFGLMDYNARYYDPYLNRFISPDTIIPDPANPQSLNRYSYVLNNPLKYTDPTGHAHWQGEDGDESVEAKQYRAPFWYEFTAEQLVFIRARTDPEYKRQVLHDYAEQQFKKFDSVEAWASTCDYAAKLSGGDPDIFMRDVSRILTGFTQRLAPFNYLAQPLLGAPPYKVSFRSDGFNNRYSDPDINNDQVRHVWFYTQIAYTWGEQIAERANYFHEYEQRGIQAGQSDNDYFAGQEGARLGTALQQGQISVYEVGDYIRYQFGILPKWERCDE